MKWALNTMKGCKIQNDDIGEIQSLTAVPLTDKQSLIAKHLRGVVVFDKIAGVNLEESFKKYSGVSGRLLESREKSYKERRTYDSFMKECKDPKIASQRWAKYKKDIGMKEDVSKKPINEVNNNDKSNNN